MVGHGESESCEIQLKGLLALKSLQYAVVGLKHLTSTYNHEANQNKFEIYACKLDHENKHTINTSKHFHNLPIYNTQI